MFNLSELPFYDVLPMGVCDFSSFKDNLFSCRAKERLPENAKSIITVLFPYYLGQEYYKKQNLSKYAVPKDYHIICSAYLEKITNFLKNKYKNSEFVYFCDNSPIDEVKSGVLSGLGVKGENSLLINNIYGSFCFIGEIVTDLKIEIEKCDFAFCIKCGKCKSKCIANAICDGKIDSDKCLSAISQKKGELEEREAILIKQSGIIWGCDICQDECPLNKNIKPTPIKEFYCDAKAYYNGIEDYTLNRAFSWRKSNVIERNFKIISCKNSKNEV